MIKKILAAGFFLTSCVDNSISVHISEGESVPISSFDGNWTNLCVLPSYEIYGSYPDLSLCRGLDIEVPADKVSLNFLSKNSCRVEFIDAPIGGINRDYFCIKRKKANAKFLTRINAILELRDNINTREELK